MDLTKIVYVNGKKTNELKSTGEGAYCELVSLLLQKINKQYKITINCNHYDKKINASLCFTDHNYYGDPTAKVKYDYIFTNVATRIDF